MGETLLCNSTQEQGYTDQSFMHLFIPLACSGVSPWSERALTVIQKHLPASQHSLQQV
jgi:hypothetical protein